MKGNTDTVKQRTTMIILELFRRNNTVLLMNYREKLTHVSNSSKFRSSKKYSTLLPPTTTLRCNSPKLLKIKPTTLTLLGFLLIFSEETVLRSLSKWFSDPLFAMQPKFQKHQAANIFPEY